MLFKNNSLVAILNAAKLEIDAMLLRLFICWAQAKKRHLALDIRMINKP